MDFDDLSYGCVGAPLQGVKVKLIDWDEVSTHFSINFNINLINFIRRAGITGQTNPTRGERY